ncbi:hypothetical protein [Phnomibacter ginsenosidimutans]|uniref:Uncharacterized protein n=1 Tax=Phnomibacter ginsenosidimutans TaxID=2676868 RepID=A0A6I6GUP4_9BACT|nr:hypothetical protein [Phnomibacter ginsenosidimutans]QGW28859.1 hypothetical protein GLV81_12815 [Phnomibacter ginsenosidimutans]
MTFKLHQYIAVSALLLMAVSCEKKVEPIDAYDVTVDYKSSNEFAVTADKEVNPKDSIFFDFTVTSPEPITYIEIQKNGVRIDTFNVTGGKTFSATKGYRADSVAGDYSYRVLARNAQATFMGDGGKLLKVTVKPDFYFWSYRILQVPDSTAKTNTCFYSSRDGRVYSYNDGAVISQYVDFGYYYDTLVANKHTIYALNSAQPQLNFYDLSTWTKNATVFKKMPTSVNFVTGLTSSGAINTLIRNNMTSGTASKVTTVSTSGGSNVIGFRTAAGKFGAILIRYVNQDSPAKATQIEVDVKVQK